MKYSLLPRHVGIQTFMLLMTGIVLIQVFSLFVFSSYRTILRYNPTRMQVANKLSHLIKVSENLSQHDIEQLLRSVEDKNITLMLTTVPPTERTLIAHPNYDAIRHVLDKADNHHVNFSLQLADNVWLNVIIDQLRPKWWVLASFVCALSITLLGSLLLCLWALRRLTNPLVKFSQAAKRLGRDMNAPPLAETGPIELHEIVHAFNEMQNRIRQLVSGRTQFLAAISHDLRTPITRLKLRAEYIPDPSNQKKIQRDLDEMTAMIDSTLSFARNTHLEETIVCFDIIALLEALCEDLITAGRQIELHLPAQKIRFHGRNLALKRSFSNLIENAVKYGKRARVTLTVLDKQLQITIDDDGPGIPEGEQDKVFEAFYRVEDSRSRTTGGTGLGMAIARDVILAHGGTIELINLQQGGLRVLLHLPL